MDSSIGSSSLEPLTTIEAAAHLETLILRRSTASPCESSATRWRLADPSAKWGETVRCQLWYDEYASDERTPGVSLAQDAALACGSPSCTTRNNLCRLDLPQPFALLHLVAALEILRSQSRKASPMSGVNASRSRGRRSPECCGRTQTGLTRTQISRRPRHRPNLD